jgi:hypothetical protein
MSVLRFCNDTTAEDHEYTDIHVHVHRAVTQFCKKILDAYLAEATACDLGKCDKIRRAASRGLTGAFGLPLSSLAIDMAELH